MIYQGGVLFVVMIARAREMVVARKSRMVRFVETVDGERG